MGPNARCPPADYATAKTEEEEMIARRDIATSDAEIEAAVAEAGANPQREAICVEYDHESDKVRVTFDDGIDIGFPRMKLQGLQAATRDQLEHIEIEGPGTGIFWPALDVAHYIPGLVEGVFGTRRWMAEIGRKGGAKKTVAKAASAKANGKLGGRPVLKTAGGTKARR
jgi:hypothetical protein